MRAKSILSILALGGALGVWIVACESDESAGPTPINVPDSSLGLDGTSTSDVGVDDAAVPSDAADAGPTRIVVYKNDFQTNTAGFDISGTGAFPADLEGGTSTYLGTRPSTTNAVLTLTNLTPGKVHELAFDVFIGGTWDGAQGFGPDFFTVTSSSSGVLVNATFRNGFPIGDPTPLQSYSDSTPRGAADGGLFRTREGADLELGEPVYYFGHGAGNPVLTFTPTSATETITFQSQDAQNAGDEFFALDNVVVTTTP